MKTIFIFFSIIVLFLIPEFSKAQFVIITGNISSKKDGSVLENVNVFESHSRIGTISNKQGNFQLMLNNGNAQIDLNYEGYLKFEKNLFLKCDTVINIQLTPCETRGKHKNNGPLLGFVNPESSNSKQKPNQ